MMVPFDIFGEPWVLFRDASGAASCIRDSCAHRACPLSLGKVVEGRVQCAYHGWEFQGDGACTKMPSASLCRNVGVPSLPCVEKDGFVWVWPGTEPPNQGVPDFTAPPPGEGRVRGGEGRGEGLRGWEGGCGKGRGAVGRGVRGGRGAAQVGMAGTARLGGGLRRGRGCACGAAGAARLLPAQLVLPFMARAALPHTVLRVHTHTPAGFDVHTEIMVDVPVEHGLLMENLLDLAHAPFTHTSTFARGWPIPEAVRFHTTRMLAGMQLCGGGRGVQGWGGVVQLLYRGGVQTGRKPHAAQWRRAGWREAAAPRARPGRTARALS